MRDLVADLLRRQRTLTFYGLLVLAVLPLTLVAQVFDPRSLDGVNVWVKPAKFLFSFGLYSLTTAWFFAYVRPEQRDTGPLRGLVATIIIAGSIELIYIIWQSAQGQASHYNTSSIFHQVMYALMGVFALLLVATTLPLAWEIARRPAAGLQPQYRAAVVTGQLLTFVLGGLLAGYMSSRTGHSVGPTGEQLPVVGWNRSGGDLRVAHFFGIHAHQAIPLLLWSVGSARSWLRWAVLAGGAAAYAILTIAVFLQAVQGRALLPHP